MAAILFFLFMWILAKGINALCHPRRKAVAKAPAETKVTRNLAALEALQEQRDIINEMIRDLEEQLDNCPPEKTRVQFMNRKTVLLGKLAVCEGKISRLCGV